ncbi:MAG: hypothetical protein JSR37_03155 [Verrucomicrobia bacterium]|nr:hypothetical protein [Verrucomicrobiota bacterium]
MKNSIELQVPDLWCPALEDANFPIFVPTGLPGDLKMRKAIIRPEDAARDNPRCSLKVLLENANGKTLSIKQFNYDWAPAAYDCPSLWKNHVEFAEVDTPCPMVKGPGKGARVCDSLDSLRGGLGGRVERRSFL